MYKQQTTSLIFALLSFALLVPSAEGGLVTFTNDFTTATNVSGSNNLGGLNTGATTLFQDGDAELNLLITIDDSAQTGSVYSAIMTMTGTRNAATDRVRANAGGEIVFTPGNDNHQNTISVSVGSITYVSGPTATVNFDGFRGATLSNFGEANDVFTFDSQTYDGTSPNSLTFNALAPSPSTFDDTGTTSWRLTGVQTQFSVTAVPEPSSLTLLSVASLGILARRRRRSR
ncbi:MAG: PEP-CTERM sorting domain-containing protein [Rubripirellula sp.]